MEHSCSCKAGQGICNHKVAFLYQAVHYSMLGLKTVPVIPSKTSLPQEWHKPRTAGVAPECSQEIQLRKPELKLNRGKKRSFDGVKSSLYKQGINQTTLFGMTSERNELLHQNSKGLQQGKKTMKPWWLS